MRILDNPKRKSYRIDDGRRHPYLPLPGDYGFVIHEGSVLNVRVASVGIGIKKKTGNRYREVVIRYKLVVLEEEEEIMIMNYTGPIYRQEANAVAELNKR